MVHRRFAAIAALSIAAGLAACGGGGSTGGGGSVAPPPTGTTPTPVPTPTLSTQQVVTMALPSTAIGVVTDPTYGSLGGYTQSVYSQSLAFAPGSQIMIRNGQAGVPHTFNVVSTTSFPASPALSTTAAGGTTIGADFASGTVAGSTTIGPFTLSPGTYYLGCAFHYVSSAMRTVLNVSAGATPGPQATAAPSATQPPCIYCY